MKKKSIFKQMLTPMIAIVSCLAVALLVVVAVFFSSFYEKEIHSRNQDKARLMAGEISTFVDGAYSVSEELSVNPSILTMDTEIQTPILADCVARNSYLELLYIQDTTGMQTGRSSGKLADRSNRWWFIQTMKEQKAFVSKSYYSVNTGMPCASIFFPMYDEDRMLGIFAVDLKLDYLQSIIEEFSDVNRGEISFVIDGEGVVVAHPDSSRIAELYNYKALTKTVSVKAADGTPVTDDAGNILTEEQSFEISEDYKALIEAVMSGNSGTTVLKENGKTYYAGYAPITLKGESDSWSVITLQEKSTAMSAFVKIMVILIVLVAAAIVAAVLFITMLARKLTRPIVSLNRLIGDASEGDFTQKADEENKNELGTLARSFNLMIEKISGIFRNVTVFTGEVVESAGSLQKIEEQLGMVNQSVHEISAGAEEQSRDVVQVTEKTKDMEQRFLQLNEQSSALLEDATSSMDSGRQGAANIEELKRQNESTIEMMQEFYRTITTLEEQSGKIAAILNTITDIASETQLLSLNASIEAARAGEQGRGFAVVAESIGKLAEDSTAATADIEQIVNGLAGDISATVANIERMKEKIDSQSGAVLAVETAFADLESLNGKTTEGVRTVESLVEEMYQINRSIVEAVERIRDVSVSTTELTEASSKSLQMQFDGIRDVAERINRLSQVSMDMENEMTRFKI
ncbi:MAG: methyl-accepting chemotaxis protein [Lachnospiraceae bacterium]|nr:methyl-accepting chemotaxis protein [Lachnospiraceae bacterium]